MTEYTNGNIIYSNSNSTSNFFVYGLIVAAIFVATIFNISQSWIYLIFFTITSICASYIELYRNRQVSNLLFGGLCSFYVCFVGFRDFGVGFDTNVYIHSYFTTALNLNDFNDLRLFEGDKGFLIIAYISTFFSTEAQALLFSCELVFVIFSFAAIYEINKGHYKINWIYFVFFFNFFYLNASMNLMRQYCAMAVMLYVLALLINDKWIKTLPFSLLAFTFHSSVVIFYPIYIIYIFSKNTTRKMNISSVFFLLVIYIMITSITTILPIFADAGIISDVYSERYGADSDMSGGSIFGPSFLVYYFTGFYLIWYSHKHEILVSEHIVYMAYMVHALYFLLRLSAYHVVYLSRISQYYSYADMMFLLIIFTFDRISIRLKMLMGICIIYMWYNNYIIHNAGYTCPYVSTILGI